MKTKIFKIGTTVIMLLLSTLNFAQTFSLEKSANSVLFTKNKNIKIIIEPLNQKACVRDCINFSVFATGTDLTYQWRKGTINLVNKGNISGATTAMLTINPVEESDTASNYNVIIRGLNDKNVISQNVSLIINSPYIITEPDDQISCEGSTASFTVNAAGTGLIYQWKKGQLSLTDDRNISGANSATLTINPVTLFDAASNYYVAITGICSPDEYSINTSLRVKKIPVIIIKPIDQTVDSGSTVSFSVTATGTDLTYQWRKGAINLINGEKFKGTTSATFTITSVNKFDVASNYNVVITGTCTLDEILIYNVSLAVNSKSIGTTALSP